MARSLFYSFFAVSATFHLCIFSLAALSLVLSRPLHLPKLASRQQNHLDMETIDALITAIQDYKGGVIVVSHDLHFLRYYTRTGR